MGMEEELSFYFQSSCQILTLLHLTLPAQAKKQSPNHGNGGRRHQGNAEQVLFQRVCSQCQRHLKIFQLLRSHLNRVKENDKEANKRRLEAMKQLNQRWHILRCYFSLLCGCLKKLPLVVGTSYQWGNVKQFSNMACPTQGNRDDNFLLSQNNFK